MYTTERPLSRPVTVTSPNLSLANGSIDSFEAPNLSPALDPALLQVAQHVYRTFFEIHPDYPAKPLGVVINQMSLRAQLIFKAKPILLMQECFIPLSQLES